MNDRVVDRYEGKETGPLLICIGGMHGNEPAGIKAIEEIFRLLQIEPSVNPGFQYRGNLVGLRGNLSALQEKKRYMQRDLNRMLTEGEVLRIKINEPGNRSLEDIEVIGLIDSVEAEIRRYNPPFTLILDLHTTTADGGIFTIAPSDEMSRQVALGLHAPVILGLSETLNGTTIEYFNKPALHQYCIVFEAGQHDDPDCVYRSVAAIVNCMRSIGSVDIRDVDHRHDGLLISLSMGLPKVTRLIHHYRIKPEEIFRMNPGYQNFQQIRKGEVVASNEDGDIESPYDGMILMPKYQSQGEDGFFIVENLDL